MCPQVLLPLTPSLELGNMFFSHYCWWCWGELLTNGVWRIDPSWQLSLHSVSCSPPPLVGWGRESDGWKWEEKPVDQDQDSLINERKKNKWCRSNHSPPASPRATAALEKLPPVLLLWMLLYSKVYTFDQFMSAVPGASSTSPLAHPEPPCCGG